jgi:hypothetical protein
VRNRETVRRAVQKMEPLRSNFDLAREFREDSVVQEALEQTADSHCGEAAVEVTVVELPSDCS